MARFAAAVNALQVAALDVVVERPAMDLESLQHVLVADDVREVLVLVPPSPSGDTLKRLAETRTSSNRFLPWRNRPYNLFEQISVLDIRKTIDCCKARVFARPPCGNQKTMLQYWQHTRRTACSPCAGNVHKGRVSFYADSSEIANSLTFPSGRLLRFVLSGRSQRCSRTCSNLT